MRRLGVLLTLLSYAGCIVVLATAPELFRGTAADYAYVPAIIAIILFGAYWFFKGIRPGNIVRFFAVLTILFMIIATVSTIEASPTGPQSQAANASQVTIVRVREYARNCFLTPVPQSSQSSSGYAVVSFGGSEVVSQGYCNGVGYVYTSARASGVYGRAYASGVLAFVDPGIFPATDSNAQSYSLNVALDFVLNGWQVSHNVGFPIASSSISLNVEFDIIDETGNVVFDLFGDSWQGSQSLAIGDHQLSYRIGLIAGHTYSAALKFTEAASATVYAVASDASATGCFHFSSSCSVDPIPGADFFCPATVGTSTGHCQDFEWRSMAYSLTAV